MEEDIEEMRAEERAQQAEATISMMELICSPTLRSPLIIGVVMQLSQQLSGINAVSALKLNVLGRIFECNRGLENVNNWDFIMCTFHVLLLGSRDSSVV